MQSSLQIFSFQRLHVHMYTHTNYIGTCVPSYVASHNVPPLQLHGKSAFCKMCTQICLVGHLAKHSPCHHQQLQHAVAPESIRPLMISTIIVG